MKDALDINTIGLFSYLTETSVNNYFTEETMLEEDDSRSKGIIGESKLDITKPNEHKIPGGI